MEVVEEGDYITLLLHCHHQNYSCIMMGSDESPFNVSVGSDGQNHKTVSTNHNLSKEKRELKHPFGCVLQMKKKKLWKLEEISHHVLATIL